MVPFIVIVVFIQIDYSLHTTSTTIFQSAGDISEDMLDTFEACAHGDTECLSECKSNLRTEFNIIATENNSGTVAALEEVGKVKLITISEILK